jgi:hypothetical protein
MKISYLVLYYAIAALGTFPVNPKVAYQLWYRTIETFSNPKATVTTILVPNNANYFRLVAKQDFEDSSWINCATLYGFEEGTGPQPTLLQASNLIEYAMLEEGWVFNVGLWRSWSFFWQRHPRSIFCSWLSSCCSASSSITGIPQDADVVISGYLGGSIGTEWTAEFQPSYAPSWGYYAAISKTIANLTFIISQSTRSLCRLSGLKAVPWQTTTILFPSIVPKVYH